MNVGDYIKKLRIDAGYTQEELGKLLNVKRAAVQKWECGKVKNLKRETIKKMASIFNVSPSSFIIDDNQSVQIELTHHEKKVITAYRDKPLVQPHVDKLLDIEPEKAPSEDGATIRLAAIGTPDAEEQQEIIGFIEQDL